ncbi:replication initiator protein [Sigmofec virus UA08Rod_5092]|uniref:Replication initiator protein n=1 Tax=Sigmofec virus UA08Rod_5092 TaxID=2929415 RepID=A0A976R7E9_9VIRU|nr:replication initiator protein [Sigmofec virus UA08Rod_5092]
MCFFPRPNLNKNSLAYKKGITEFDCGYCPECLHKRANVWALRSVFESRDNAFNSMITLTYDSFKHDEHGNFIYDRQGHKIENPVDPDKKVCKRDIQLFKKRLREFIFRKYGIHIKMLVTAEYGSRTHRAHYHALIFGFDFPDRFFYKKSKRGNAIYMSATLSKLWKLGICTIDSVNVSASVARYCTKYCAKSRSDDTFMLSSPKIGLNGMLRAFNGRSYLIDGIEYSVPRVVWQEYITRKYKPLGLCFDYRYRNRNHYVIDDAEFNFNVEMRDAYRYVRDNDSVYQRYLEYWRHKSELYEYRKRPVRERLLSLPENKFHFFKEKALQVYDFSKATGVSLPCPNSYVRTRDVIDNYGVFSGAVLLKPSEYIQSFARELLYRVRNPLTPLPFDTCPQYSRLLRASDRLLNVYTGEVIGYPLIE